ncbi:hypothetical protein SC367_09050, partial [Actinotignum timonense]
PAITGAPAAPSAPAAPATAAPAATNTPAVATAPTATATPKANAAKPQLAHSGAELGSAIGAATVLLGAGGALAIRRARN